MTFAELPTGIRMYYEVHGEAGDPFLLLGGTGSDHLLWTAHVPALSRRFPTITPHPRGTGATTRPSDPTSCTMRVMAQDAAVIADPPRPGPGPAGGRFSRAPRGV